MKTLKFLAVIFLLFISSITFAQDDNESDFHYINIDLNAVAQLEIKSKTSRAITLNAEAPNEAGEKVTFGQTNNDLWLNYSSIAFANSSRNIAVQITNGNVPEGIDLTVISAKYVGNGDGLLGEPVKNPILLNNKKATNIIEGIGSAYTGYGPESGHNLTYKIAQSSSSNAYASLDFKQSTTLTITYTLSDN